MALFNIPTHDVNHDFIMKLLNDTESPIDKLSDLIFHTRYGMFRQLNGTIKSFYNWCTVEVITEDGKWGVNVSDITKKIK